MQLNREPHSQRRVIIFDFDGTLADTLEVIIEGYNQEVAQALGSRPFNPSRLDEYKRSGTLASLLKEHGISLARFPQLLFLVKKHLRREMRKIPFFPGMREVVEHLSLKGYTLGILTSNSVKNVAAFLAKEKATSFFRFVYSSSRWYGKDRTMRKILRQENIQIDQVVYVGDESRDIVFARKMGIPVISVTWGMYHGDRLAKRQPDFLVHSPAQLLQVIQLSL